MIGVGAFELFAGGAAAVFTPAFALAAAVVVAAGICMGPHRRSREHLLVAGVLLAVVGLGVARTGLQPFTSTARFLVAGLLVLLLDLGRRESRGHRGLAALWALLLALVCIMLRAPHQGPLLAALGGSWERGGDFGLALLYHLGSGAILGLLYLVAGGIGAKAVAPRWGGWLGVAGALGLALAASVGWLAAASQQLLLRWPVTLWG